MSKTYILGDIMSLDKNNAFISMVKSVVNKNFTANSTFISLDLKNGVIIDSFQKLIDFSDTCFNLLAAGRKIYIYGENLRITSYNKEMIYINGKINKIEIFEV